MKISCRADFPKISRTLVIDADFDGEAFVWVTDSDTPQLSSLEKFNDWHSAIYYYASQYVLFAEKEFLEEALSHPAIKYLQSRPPDVFFYVDRIGYVQAWKYGSDFWPECKGVNGEHFTHKFHGDDMINTCETYFSALRAGDPPWEV